MTRVEVAIRHIEDFKTISGIKSALLDAAIEILRAEAADKK